MLRRNRWTAALLAMAFGLPVGCAPRVEKRFERHVRYLADDAREGRGVGSRGLELSADYIAREFKRAGLMPAGDQGTYFQAFPMTLHRELTDEARLSLGAAAGPLALGADFTPLSFSSNEAFSGEVVFAGYGIVSEDPKWDDFAHVDLKGKVALMLTGEPAGWADKDGFPTRHSLLQHKVYNAKDRGAAAIVFVDPASTNGPDRLPRFDADSPDDYGLPAFQATRAVAERVLAAGGAAALPSLEADLAAGRMASKALAGVTADGAAGFVRRESPTWNVCGMIDGEGPLSNEWIVLGAHYDHLGIRKPMGRKFKGGKAVADDEPPQIHNGADDNASGVAGLIEVARMFQRDARPRRSVMFVAFSAEESGLHGSKFFVANSPIPVDRIVGMLNMDMIGRLNPDTRELTVFGVGCGEGFGEILRWASAGLNLKLLTTDDPGGRSDHAAFVAKKVPSLHLYTGSHTDYHRPSDDTHLVNFAGGAEVTRLVYGIARELADREARLEFVEVKSSEEQRGMTGFRVVMGLTPNYTDTSQPGMGVDGVSPEGPAQLAGMQAGDRILSIGGKMVNNVYDYMASTRNNKAGDVVEVVVIRGGERKVLSVTLAGAR
jgi:hypothetical protein